ncbi:hypothetical protein CHGG_08223 [Chaetomium globosum CBS 148.51]|uniref:VWFA domain-containing protein n=1 Tax=Chaetomium globosum (strain ATCC 6205 / CBS 148.51 / DSM 1962 / NBRC 6347 / NRRL 1970) TaxID=306901 RepID=Q2GUY1_CHAGB|nr:uncharacterized protein CHGG_08223 [Chaetomium globosum CBS 148.51]EAQ86970.1 hypothetical protein CHGG_08223 [Chaetomium globosum CBS 148.51]
MSQPAPSKSLFGSLKDKLSSKKNRSRSPSPNPFATQTENYSQAPPSSDTKFGATDAPPPYSAVAPAAAPAGPSSTPLITLNTPPPARQASPAPSFVSARSDPSITSREDPYAFLSSFDTIFLIDDSGSMAGKSWREVKEVISGIAPVCTSHDANGIDVYFLNARDTGRHSADNPAQGFRNITTTKQVEDLFKRVRPQGATPTGTRISAILKPYLREYERAAARTGNPDDCGVKPVNMIVITDGAPTDDPESVIINIARKLDTLDAPPHQVGIQFFQVGNDPQATKALKELDDGLSEQGGGIRDIVDTVTWAGSGHVLSADAILKVVLGAVVKRLDRRRLSGESRRSARYLAP